LWKVALAAGTVEAFFLLMYSFSSCRLIGTYQERSR
jgi:hypothetical protein